MLVTMLAWMGSVYLSLGCGASCLWMMTRDVQSHIDQPCASGGIIGYGVVDAKED